MIQLQQVKKCYDMGEQHLTVLHGIDLTIETGELVAIIGPSGSGKSTCMNIIGLLDKPSEGSYYLNEQNVSNLSADKQSTLRNQLLGFIFQSFYLLPKFTALENVMLPLLYRNLPTKVIEKSAKNALAKVDIDHLWHHKPTELSGGQQQRVAIARALVGEPKVILADEPTGALDSKTSRAVMDLLINLNTESKATTIIVTHDPNIANQCQRVIEIEDGRIS